MEFNRRTVIKGFLALPFAGTFIAPDAARAEGPAIEPVTIRTAGGRTVKATLTLPGRLPAEAVVMVHDWWGVNKHITSAAANFAEEGYLALAIDLYHGKVTADEETARRNARATRAREAMDTMTSWIGWLQKSDRLNGRIAIVGWGLGGAWALNAAVTVPLDAAILYYSRIDLTARFLRRLQGPVLGHFATHDHFADRKSVTGFEAEMKKAGRGDGLTVHWYDADRGFADPTGPHFDSASSRLAVKRTLAFLRDQM